MPVFNWLKISTRLFNINNYLILFSLVSIYLEKIVLRVWHELPSYPDGHLQRFGATQTPPFWQLQMALNKKNDTLFNRYGKKSFSENHEQTSLPWLFLVVIQRHHRSVQLKWFRLLLFFVNAKKTKIFVVCLITKYLVNSNLKRLVFLEMKYARNRFVRMWNC